MEFRDRDYICAATEGDVSWFYLDLLCNKTIFFSFFATEEGKKAQNSVIRVLLFAVAREEGFGAGTGRRTGSTAGGPPTRSSWTTAT